MSQYHIKGCLKNDVDIMAHFPWFLCWVITGYMMYYIYGFCYDLLSYRIVDEYME